jgi:hypothetical protein
LHRDEDRVLDFPLGAMLVVAVDRNRNGLPVGDLFRPQIAEADYGVALAGLRAVGDRLIDCRLAADVGPVLFGADPTVRSGQEAGGVRRPQPAVLVVTPALKLDELVVSVLAPRGRRERASGLQEAKRGVRDARAAVALVLDRGLERAVIDDGRKRVVLRCRGFFCRRDGVVGEVIPQAGDGLIYRRGRGRVLLLPRNDLLRLSQSGSPGVNGGPGPTPWMRFAWEARAPVRRCLSGGRVRRAGRSRPADAACPYSPGSTFGAGRHCCKHARARPRAGSRRVRGTHFGGRPHSRWFRGLRRTRSDRGTPPLHARRRPAARESSGGGHRYVLMLSAVVGCGRPSHPAGPSMSLMYGAPRQMPGGAGSGPDRFALPEAARELRDDSGTEGIRHLQDVVMDRVVVADAGAIVAAELM